MNQEVHISEYIVALLIFVFVLILSLTCCLKCCWTVMCKKRQRFTKIDIESQKELQQTFVALEFKSGKDEPVETDKTMNDLNRFKSSEYEVVQAVQAEYFKYEEADETCKMPEQDTSDAEVFSEYEYEPVVPVENIFEPVLFTGNGDESSMDKTNTSQYEPVEPVDDLKIFEPVEFNTKYEPVENGKESCSIIERDDAQIDYEEYTRSNNIESKEDVAAKIIEADMDSQTDYEESKGIESSADSSIKNGSEMSSIEEASKLNDDYVQYTNSDNRDDAAKTTEADMEEISTNTSSVDSQSDTSEISEISSIANVTEESNFTDVSKEKASFGSEISHEKTDISKEQQTKAEEVDLHLKITNKSKTKQGINVNVDVQVVLDEPQNKEVCNVPSEEPQNKEISVDEGYNTLVDRTHDLSKSVRNIQCIYCDRMYKDISGMKNHIKMVHKNEMTAEAMDILDETSSFTRTKSKKSRRRAKNNVLKTVPCPHCPQKVSTDYGLKLHLNSSHGIQ